MFKRILIPTDLHEISIVAVKLGVEMARRFDAELFLLNVRPEFMNKNEMEMLRVSVQKFLKEERDIATSAKLVLQEMLMQAGGEDVKHKIILREGHANPEILSTAEEMNCDLIIVTTTGRSRLGEHIYGSDSEQLVRDTKTPILVLPVSKDRKED